MASSVEHRPVCKVHGGDPEQAALPEIRQQGPVETAIQDVEDGLQDEAPSTKVLPHLDHDAHVILNALILLRGQVAELSVGWSRGWVTLGDGRPRVDNATAPDNKTNAKATMGNHDPPSPSSNRVAT